MVIEYRVKDMNDGTIVPFTPQYRRKLKGFCKLFQFMFQWNTFPCYSVGGDLICIKRFGEFNDAVAFLQNIESPMAYFKELKRINSAKLNHCQFEKEY